MAFLEGIFVNLNQFEWKKESSIGSGAYGFCYIVTDKRNPEKQLCAKITQDIVQEAKEQEELLREVVILKNVKHNAILEFKGFNLYDFEQQPKPTIITEFMRNGSLDKMLQKENQKKAPPEWNATKKQICIIGIAAAMRYLHKRRLMHRDLKPANVLLDDNLYPKVCDFGFARASLNLEKVTKRVGSPIYMAPEVIHGDDKYDLKVDVYSFAILAYEVCTGLRPFDEFFKTHRHPNLPSLVKWVYDQQKRPEFGNCNVNQNFKDLIVRCWKHSPNDRPTFDDIYDSLVDDRNFVINDQVDIEEVQEYIDSIQDDSTEGGKAKLDISSAETIYDSRPKVEDDAIPSDDKQRVKMFNDYMQNGFSGDSNLAITLFTKMLGSICTDKDPQNFVKITYFANKLAQEGNKKAINFLKNAFGQEIAKNKDSVCDKDVVNKTASYINISPSVKVIKANAFAGLKNLLYLNIPLNVVEIEPYAFKGCRNLIWVNLNNQVKEIKEGTFEDCPNLKYVEFPSNLTLIKKNAFRKCISLEQVHIPRSVTLIEPNAFHGCKKLKVVHMSSQTSYSSASSFPLRAQIIT